MSTDAPPETHPAPPDLRKPRWRDPGTVQTVAAVLVIAAAGWFLLIQLAPLLRPLLVAAFLAYVLMPYHARLRKRVGTPASLGILAGVTAAAIGGLALAVYASVVGLADELPRLEQRVLALTRGANEFLATNAPWLGVGNGEKGIDEHAAEEMTQVAKPLLNAVAGTVLEACVVGLYLLFL